MGLNPGKVAGKMTSLILKNLMGTVTHVETTTPVVAITFDDGPDPVYTPKVIDTLSKYGAHATFFIVGKAAQRHPELVRMIAERGHAVGNHSWDHPSFPLVSREERRDQIMRCEEFLKPYGVKIFRPPYGDQDVSSRLDAFLLGYSVVTWDVVALDWLDHSAESMLRRVTSQIRAGSIVLFHDSLFQHIREQYLDRYQMLKALDMLLSGLGEKYKFITIPEIFKYGRKRYVNWYQEPAVELLNNLKSRYGSVRRYT